MVNIRDIAKKSGVSVATVSHVINRSRYVSDKLINRVEKVMKDLNYQPNLLAGSLRKKKTGTIGLVIPDSSNMLFADISKCFEDIFFLKNYNIIVCNSAYDLDREVEHLKNLRSKMVDGILMIPSTLEGGHIKKIQSSGIPVVILDRKIPGLKVDYIMGDSYRGGFEAGRYITDMGHSDIGYIDWINTHFHSTERKKGFEAALLKKGMKLPKKRIAKGGLAYHGGVEAVKKLIEDDSGLTAIFAFNDTNALGAIKGLTDLGYKVPDDISVMGYDDIHLSSVFIPGLTTMHYPVKKLTSEASRVLLDRIKQPIFSNYKEILIEPKLIIRESTKAR